MSNCCRCITSHIPIPFAILAFVLSVIGHSHSSTGLISVFNEINSTNGFENPVLAGYVQTFATVSYAFHVVFFLLILLSYALIGSGKWTYKYCPRSCIISVLSISLLLAWAFIILAVIILAALVAVDSYLAVVDILCPKIDDMSGEIQEKINRKLRWIGKSVNTPNLTPYCNVISNIVDGFIQMTIGAAITFVASLQFYSSLLGVQKHYLLLKPETGHLPSSIDPNTTVPDDEEQPTDWKDDGDKKKTATGGKCTFFKFMTK